MTDRAVIFLHLPKTAGTTLRAFLAGQFRPDEVFSQRARGGEAERAYLRYLRGESNSSPLDDASDAPPRHLRALAEVPEGERARFRLLMGHFWFGVHEGLPRPSTYMTVIRDPVDRVLSHHHHRVVHQRLDQTLAEYLEADRDFEIRNAQTRRIAGPAVGGDITGSASAPALLDAARDHLRASFDVVGVTERLDEFLVLLQATFGWRRWGYLSQNVSRGRPPRERVSPDLVAVIEERNRLDRELHRYAGELLTEGLQASGADVETELRRLRRWSAIYRRARPAVRVGNRLRRLRRRAGP